MVDAGDQFQAFGNAVTVQNNNSSRFGKFIKVNYRENGMVSGLVRISFAVFKAPPITVLFCSALYSSKNCAHIPVLEIALDKSFPTKNYVKNLLDRMLLEMNYKVKMVPA